MSERRFSLIIKITTIALSGLAWALPSAAGKTDQDAIDFVVGSFEFVLLHELAHLVIAEKEVPIIGPIESAADYIAATVLVREDGAGASEKALRKRFVLNAAKAFSTAWQLGVEREVEVPYWGAHALGIQRYYSLICLLYGSDPAGQQQLPEAAGLPLERAAGCPAEFEVASRGVKWLQENYGRKAGQASGQTAYFQYGSPRNSQQTRILEEIRHLNIFEQTVNAFTDQFVFERPFVASIRTCGRAEAAWQAEKRELVICYELLDAFFFVHNKLSHTN